MSNLRYTQPWGLCAFCGGAAYIHVWPDPKAGLWVCIMCNKSGQCTHKNTEEREITYYRPTQEQINNGTDRDVVNVYMVCTDCEVTIE